MLKTKEQILVERLGSINESTFKMGDMWNVRATFEVPRSLINAFVSKAKKENGVDPREMFSDMEMAELFISFIKSTYLNIESIPVAKIIGEMSAAPSEATDTIEPAQPLVQEEPDNTGTVTGEINEPAAQPLVPVQTEEPLAQPGVQVQAQPGVQTQPVQ